MPRLPGRPTSYLTSPPTSREPAICCITMRSARSLQCARGYFTHRVFVDPLWTICRYPDSSHAGRKQYSSATERQEQDCKWKLPKDFAPLKTSTNVQQRNRIQADHLPPLSASDQRVEQELRHSVPAHVFRDCVSNGTASVHVVRLCLEAQRLKVRLKGRKDRQSLLDVQRRDRLASLVLRHIWEDNRWIPIMFYDPRTVENLAYYAILEGLEDVLLRWTTVVTPEMDLEGWANMWRGALLRQILAAYISHDTNADAGPALVCLIDAVRQKDAAVALNKNRDPDVAEKDTPILVLSVRPAINEMYATLCTPFCYNTSPDLFGEFLKIYKDPHRVRKGHLEESGERYGIARLKLWHPAQPDEQEAMGILRDHAQRGIDDGAILPMLSRPLMKQSFQKFLQRTIDVASHNANTQHVVWVKQSYKDFLRPGGVFAPPTQIGRPKLVPLSYERVRARTLDRGELPPKPKRIGFPTFT